MQCQSFIVAYPKKVVLVLDVLTRETPMYMRLVPEIGDEVFWPQHLFRTFGNVSSECNDSTSYTKPSLVWLKAVIQRQDS